MYYGCYRKFQFFAPTLANMTSTDQERKIRVGEFNINYLKVGNGSKVVLLNPGALGSIWTDFKSQIEYFDREKFTIVAWDPPGWGKSRPPDRVYSIDFNAKDAAIARDLMKALGYEKFSLIGWNTGGCRSLYMAALYPENIEKVVLTATPAYETPEHLEMLTQFKDIDAWSPQVRDPMLTIYDREYLQKSWAEHVENVKAMSEKNENDIVKHLLPDVECPVLIVHGALGKVVKEDQAEYLKTHIKNSKLHILEEGGHNAHMALYEEFNEIVTAFLLE